MIGKNKTKEQFQNEIKELKLKIANLKKFGNERNQTEDKLRKSEKKYRTIVSSMNDIIFLLDKNDKFVDFDCSESTLLYIQPEKIIGKKHKDIMPDYVNKKYIESAKKVRETGKTQQFDYPLEIKGKEKWFRVNLDLYSNRKDIIAGIREITKQKETEKSLKESEERFRAIVENSHDGIFTIDGNYRLEYINDTFCEILGFGKKEIINHDFRDFLGEDSRKLVQDRYVKHQRGESVPTRYEFNIIRKDGKKRRVEIKSTVVENSNGNIKTIAQILDITECKQVVESLRASKEKQKRTFSLLRLMTDTMPDMLWAKDLDKKFIFTNKAMCKKLLNAKDTNEPLGKTDIFFAKREHDSHPNNPNWHTFGELCQNSDEITLKNLKEMQFDEYGNVKGKFLYLDVHKALLYNDKSKLIGIVGSANDITERKQAEENLRKLKDELEIKVEKRTKELKEKEKFLQRFHDATIEREFRIKELRDEIEELKKKVKL